MTNLTGVQKTVEYLLKYGSTWFLLLLAIGVPTLFLGVVQLCVANKKLANLPPGPRNWPIVGALFAMGPKLHKSFDRLSKQYGPVVYLRLGVQDITIVSSPEAAEEFLKQKDTEFADREAKMTRSSSKYVALNGAVFAFADFDDDLKFHRKLLISELLTVGKIKAYEALRTRETAALVEDIFRRIRRSTDGEGDHNITNSVPLDIGEITHAMVRNIMFSLAVGKRYDSLPPADELREFPIMVEEMMKIVMKINIVDFFPFLTWMDPQGLIKRMKAFEKLQIRFYKGIVERNRRAMILQRESRTVNDADEATRNSLVQILLRAQEEGTQLSDTGIMSTMLSVLSAGIDTTGTQMEWALLHLARHPKLLQRLQDEIDAIVGKERPLEDADLPALPFLNAVILETLRLNPVLPYSFAHVNKKPVTLCGYNIPANTAGFLNIYSIGRDPKSWKDPLQFNPDRFMLDHGQEATTSPAETIRATGQYFQLPPFGSGRRMCPGYNLALFILTRAVGALVHAFDWVPPPGCSPEDLSVEDEGSIVLYPTPKLYLVPRPRLPTHVYKSNLVQAESS